jgi:AcrR family transcriptional regulator
MRRLAAEVGAKPMSLYRHVTDRDDVLDGVYALILAEVRTPALDDVEWQTWVRQAWTSYRRALLTHPRATAAVARRPVSARSGPFVMLADASIGALRLAGLDVEEALHVQRLLAGLTVGLVIGEINWHERQATTGPTGSVLIPAEEFPYFTEALPMILRMDFQATFEYALGMIVNWVEDRVRSTGTSS